MSNEEAAEAFRRFLSEREALAKSSPTAITRFDEFELSSNPNDLVFNCMAADFTRELINSLNKFIIYIQYGDAWARVADGYEESERATLLYQYAEPYLENAMNRPYALRNHFVYAAINLFHQTNKHALSGWRDELPKERNYDYKLMVRLGTHWKMFSAFRAALDTINDDDHAKETRDYRNLSHHRFELNIGWGLYPYIRRDDSKGSVVYHLEAIPSINTRKLISELYRQHANAQLTFRRYWDLLNELLATWTDANARRSLATK